MLWLGGKRKKLPPGRRGRPIDPIHLAAKAGEPAMLQFHVAISLVGILSGLVMLYGLLLARNFRTAIAVFFVTTILTSLTGFPLPPFGFDPPRAVGVLSLILLIGAVAAYYAFRLAGAMAMDLCRLRGCGALSQRVRACGAGVHEGPGPSRARADWVRAAVRDRPGDRAAHFHCAWDSGRDQVSAGRRAALGGALTSASAAGCIDGGRRAGSKSRPASWRSLRPCQTTAVRAAGSGCVCRSPQRSRS